MIIEIRMAGFVNKGAELMLLAVIQKVRERYPTAKITMAPVYGAADDTFERMQRLKLYPRIWFVRKGIDFGFLSSLIPDQLLKMYGLIKASEVDVVLDAAGFAYTDQWGNKLSQELSSSSVKWKKNKTKLIMLPQALGPYSGGEARKFVKSWASNADLIFPREPDSYKYLTDIVGEHEKIRCFPDFTNLVEGTLPEGYDFSNKRIALVPNFRMIDKTSKEESSAYLPFMINCAKYLLEKGAQPFLLVHEGVNDKNLAEKISDAVGGIPVVLETNPLHIKGILGTCDATISSRFHGLVSALSQGVPSIATGWSHKYVRLFEDYDFKEGLVSVLDSKSVLHEKIDLLLSPETAGPLRLHLQRESEIMKDVSKNMWDLVFSKIEESI